MEVSISDYYQQRVLPKVRGEILRESDEQIIGSDTDQLQLYYYDKQALPLIEEDADKGPSWEPIDYLKNIAASEREWAFQSSGPLIDFQCQKVVVEFPIRHNKYISILSDLRSNTISTGYSDSQLEWQPTLISFAFETKGYGFNRSDDEIAKKVAEIVQDIRDIIRLKNEAIAAGNASLLNLIAGVIAQRKQQIASNISRLESLTSKINIPLKKMDVIGARPIRIAEQPIVTAIKPKPNLPAEYVVDSKMIRNIIDYLDNQAKSYEKASATIRKLGEEALRDLLLANLNSVFQGAATGETFSKKGDSDIYLRIDEGNILICECKIWGGKKLYGETIDQLRGYLTWRHNYGIIICFVRNKGMTSVLQEAGFAITGSDSYKHGFKKVNETHFVSLHRLDDKEKDVTIHHLFYHMASEE